MSIDVSPRPLGQCQSYTRSSIRNKFLNSSYQLIHVRTHLHAALNSSFDLIEKSLEILTPEKNFFYGKLLDYRGPGIMNIRSEVKFLGKEGIVEMCSIEISPYVRNRNIQVEVLILVQYSSDEMNKQTVG